MVFGLLAGIGIAIVLSVADLFARIARAHDAVQGEVPGLAGLHDVDDYPEATTIPGLVVYRYDAPLCFANAEDVRSRVLEAVEDAEAPVEWVVLNMEANVEIDLTAADMLEDLRAELRPRHRARAGPRQARPRRVPRSGGSRSRERWGPHLPHAADRARGLPTATPTTRSCL